MIDPRDVTNFERSEAELEEFLFFCLLVHGKRAETQAEKLADFLRKADPIESPFAHVQRLRDNGTLLPELHRVGFGQYDKLCRCLEYLVASGLDLRTCSVEDLEAIPGIGPKTARYFLLHSRPDQELAVLDVHILSWLRDQGYHVPRQTPSGSRYARLENAFLDICRERGCSAAELDLEIWKSRQIRKLEPQS